MKIYRIILPLTALPLILLQLLLLNYLTPSTRAESPLTTLTYITATTLFLNPERGFYHHTQTHSNDYTPLDLTSLKSYRQTENISLILRLFCLDDFVNSNISQTYLDAMQQDFDTIRAAGLKAIIRFAYTTEPHFAPGTTEPPIPPYGDATKEQMRAHLDQLRPVLQANSDVIAVVQAGFIGIWGEWFYTDHFVQNPNNPDVITTADWANRAELLSAMLAALPSDRMVQVRTPLIKQEIFSRTSAITPGEAYNGSYIARTGHHNDCFLASDTDFGTYVPEVITAEKTYLTTETQYLPMGGETCAPNPPRSDCPTALEELARFHWSYLNIDYQPDVLDKWEIDGCLDEIKQRLGFHFTLIEGTYANEVNPGDVFTFNIKLQNDGWAAPFNPRPVKLLLRHITNGLIYEAPLPDDPRSWLADDGTIYSLNHVICTPANMIPGNYELLLNLPDPKSSLAERPEYAIHLANEMVWEADTGYNKLLHTITVLETAINPGCNNDPRLGQVSKVHMPVILRTF